MLCLNMGIIRIFQSIASKLSFSSFAIKISVLFLYNIKNVIIMRFIHIKR